MEEIKIFENPEFGKIRTAGTSEKPLFCLADICKIFSLQVTPTKNRLKSDGVSLIKGVSKTTNQYGVTTEQEVEMLFINEQNLYRLIMRSDKPIAEPFQDWVCEEVLPTIRKTGSYNLPSYQISDPIKRAEKWIEEEKERQKLLEKLEEQKPKVEYFDKLVDRKLNTNFRDTAKEIGLKQNDFIAKLIEAKYIYRDVKGKIKPYAKYAEDLFIIKECASGDKWAGMQTLITPKGRETFSLLFGE